MSANLAIYMNEISSADHLYISRYKITASCCNTNMSRSKCDSVVTLQQLSQLEIIML